MIRKGSLAVIFAVVSSVLFPLSGVAAADIVDISYEHCVSPGSHRAVGGLGHYTYGIVGVNKGGDWEKNPCLEDETHHFNNYALYVNTNYPSDGCHTHPSRTNAYNCGYLLGLWDVEYASREHAHSNAWFLDVEGGPGTGISWTSHSLNASFLYGLSTALQSRGATIIGYYSTDLQWQNITGGWHSGNYAWYATGSNGQPSGSAIHRACHSDFTGGGVILYQYISGGYSSGIDHDGSC